VVTTYKAESIPFPEKFFMVTKASLRKLMIEKQRLSTPIGEPTKEKIFTAIDHLGCLQIDSINVIERSHYLTLWSRLGNYEKTLLDNLAYVDRKLFEYWAHATCFIPLKDYRFYIHSMNVRKEEMLKRLRRRTGRGEELINHVLERIRDEGPLASKDFDSEKKGKGGWWNRKDEKVAMDYLYGAGVLAVTRRNNFQRYYDLTENVVPDWVDTDAPTDDEHVRFFIERTMKALGAIRAKDAREYFQHFSVILGRTSSQIEDSFEEQDNIVRIQVEDSKEKFYCLEEDAGRLEEIDDDFDYDGVQMIVYFDNFMWNRDRIKKLFGFESKLEIYVPPDQRIYGYYHLPILYGDKLVSRIEPKVIRGEETLLIRGYWPEPGFEESEDYRVKFERNLKDFAVFNGAKTIKWLDE
jgi:uncharacterized protein YcaQ